MSHMEVNVYIQGFYDDKVLKEGLISLSLNLTPLLVTMLLYGHLLTRKVAQ